MRPLDPLGVSLDGTRLIEASAGTGKTHTITTLFLRLLLEQGRAVSEILVVTYTRAATAELRGRIRQRIARCLDELERLSRGVAAVDGELRRLLEARGAHADADRRRLSAALRDFDEAPIFTIHAFCQKVLAEWAFESGAPFELDLLDDERPVRTEVVLDFWASRTYTAERTSVERLLRGGTSPQKLQELADKVIANRDVEVLPLEAPTLAEVGAEGNLARARDRVVELWRSDRAAVLHELSVPGRLNLNSFAPERVERLARELDSLVETGALSRDVARRLCTTAVRKATKKGHAAPAHALFDACEALVEALDETERADQARVLSLRRELVDYARIELLRRKRERAQQSFDDLLHGVLDALERPGGEGLARAVAARYPAALIDEFQDTDPVQYGIFRRLHAAGASTLFLIGDPKQAIYAFRGADIFAYVQAVEAVGEHRYTLRVNHRSDPAFVRALNVTFSRLQLPFVFPEIGYVEVEAPPEASDRLAAPRGAQDERANDAALSLLFLPWTKDRGARAITKRWTDEHLPGLVAGEIARLLSGGPSIEGEPVAPRDIAVLCRTNKEARLCQVAIAALGIPTVLDGDSSVFDSEMALELERVLSALARPGDFRRIVAALTTSVFGLGARELALLQDDEEGGSAWLERFAAWAQTWRERGFIQAFYRMLDEAEVQPRLLSRTDGERRLTDLLHLAELLHEAAMRRHLGPQALLHTFTQLVRDDKTRGELAAESAQLRLEHDEHAVRLTTIHRSKGLQYPVVFCPFLWGAPRKPDEDLLFHDREDAQRLKLDIGSEQRAAHERWATLEAMSENMRLLYVALTRAQHRCYVVWGRFNEGHRSALAYLLHQGEAGGAEVPAEAVAERCARLDEASMRAELEALCAASAGAISLRNLEPFPVSDVRRAVAPAQELVARVPAAPFGSAHRTSSFSSLVAGPAESVSAAAADGVDRDEGDATPAEEAGSGPIVPRLILHEFPPGPQSGSLVHAVYEHIDFQSPDDSAIASEVERQLSLSGRDAGAHATALTRAIAGSLRTPLGAEADPPRLCEVPRTERLDELEFTFPAADPEGLITPERLSHVFARHRSAGGADYATRLAQLRFAPFRGFLRGFIDVAFRLRGRFFVADYKTNRLGDAAADYGRRQLEAAMSEHHYYLQYHLYVLALHRYLALRLGDYDYERDFGGVYYLFVRGMAPQHEPGTGVFFDRPSRALIEDLDALFRADGGAA